MNKSIALAILALAIATQLERAATMQNGGVPYYDYSQLVHCNDPIPVRNYYTDGLPPGMNPRLFRYYNIGWDDRIGRPICAAVNRRLMPTGLRWYGFATEEECMVVCFSVANPHIRQG